LLHGGLTLSPNPVIAVAATAAGAATKTPLKWFTWCGMQHVGAAQVALHLPLMLLVVLLAVCL